MATSTFAKKIKAFFTNRHVLFSILCVIIFGVLAAQLMYLTVDQGDYYYAQSLERERVELTLDGSRGRILDRNGVPMAVNTQIYVVEIDRQRMPSDQEELNRVLARTLSIIAENDDTKCLSDTIPIKWREDTGELYYVWEDSGADTQAKKIKNWYNEIDAGTGSVKISLEDSADPVKMLAYLRERYDIPAEDTEEIEGIPTPLALMMISVRLDLYLKRYSQYEPIQIASGIREETVAQLSTHSAEMPGVNISVEEGRYYPMGDTAAHIVGYVTKITEKNDPEVLEEQGYDQATDKVGQIGVEKFAEAWLTGCTSDKQGKLIAEVDSRGKVVRTLEKIEPKDGNDVVLTIDSRLQKAVEDILEVELEKMRLGGEPYDAEAPLVKNGAAVVLDLHTGEVLAMASYPSFDLNLFPNGISNDDFNALQFEDPANPLFATAFQGHMIPGSVVKPAVAIASLEEGVISTTDKVYDKLHYYFDSTTSSSCWSPTTHGWETVQDAIRNSCNYFFIEMGMRLGIDRINKWTDAFGLSSHTGLEIIEKDDNVFASPAEKERLFKKSATMGPEIRTVLGRGGYDEVGQDVIEALVNLEIGEDSRENLNNIRRTLQEYEYFVFKDTDGDGLDDVTGRTRNATDQNFANAGGAIRYTLSNFQNWMPVDTGQAAYGQGYSQISPLCIARYIAALANGGHVIDTRVVKEAVTQDGTLIYESNVNDEMTLLTDSYYDEDGTLITTVEKILPEVGADPAYMEYVKEGMYRVVYDRAYTAYGRGTAASYFMTLDDSITLGGKTGTAQVVAGTVERNNAWFVCFSPYEDPEIVVVVAVPNGRTSGNAAPIARKILEQYYSIQREDLGEVLPDLNTLTP